jgi:Uma2 family endonuclease
MIERFGAVPSASRDALLRLIPAGWHLQTEAAIRIPDWDEPEPDLAVVRGKSRDYVVLKRPPEPAEVSLVIEIAESTLSKDRGEKQAAYASARVPVYWIINLVDQQVEVYTDPQGDTYRSRQDFKPGQDLTVLIDPVVVGQIAVADVLP